MLSYVQDPCANIKTGFGYSVPTKNKNGGSINFVKGETMNLQNNQIPDKNNGTKQHKEDTIKSCDTNEGNVKFIIFFFSLVKLFYFYTFDIFIFFLALSQIDDLSLLISSKLHFLSDCENNEKLSSVQVMTIKIDVSQSCICESILAQK